MSETIYTIPINAAFDQAAAAERATCPFCVLDANLNHVELDRILGAAMMEPSIRIETNKKGFCRTHYDAMLNFRDKNRLSIALMLESHLDVVRKQVGGGIIGLAQAAGKAAGKKIQRQEASCYICDKVNYHFGKMLTTAAWMFANDGDFRKQRLPAQSMICLPHFSQFTEAGRAELGKRDFTQFYAAIEKITLEYFDSLREDVSGFCKMFDYRSEGQEWGNKRDSIERAMNFLTGEPGAGGKK